MRHDKSRFVGDLLPRAASRNARSAVLVGSVIIAAFLLFGLLTRDRPIGRADAESRKDLSGSRPITVRPAIIRLVPITREQSERIDHQIQSSIKTKMSLSYCLHLLRIYGADARVLNGRSSPGHAVLGLLTDERTGSAYFGKPPLFRTSCGLRFASGNSAEASVDRSLELHRDQTLAALGELGLPLDHILTVDGGVGTLRDVLKDSTANFYIDQKELAWTTIAYALYLPPAREWVNRYGERHSFDELVDALLRQPLDGLSCGGAHNLFALTILARCNQRMRILSERVQDRVQTYLSRCLAVVERSQATDGSWPASWNHELLPGGQPKGRSLRDSRENRMMMTGHLAEWLLYLPDELRPPETEIRRAAGWLLEQLVNAGADDIERSFCPYSHAACVLRQVAYVAEGAQP